MELPLHPTEVMNEAMKARTCARDIEMGSNSHRQISFGGLRSGLCLSPVAQDGMVLRYGISSVANWSGRSRNQLSRPERKVKVTTSLKFVHGCAWRVFATSGVMQFERSISR